MTIMSYHVYPVLPWEDTCEDYQVKINGVPVELNTARVSNQPFNRRWPGHQRQKSQTELINFLSMEMDEPVTFEITPKEPFETVIIRPLSLGIQPEIIDGTITFTLEKPAFLTVEPYGINRALHIFADPVSEYDVDFEDENVIYFGPGEHEAGTIEMKSGQTLFLDEGAVVYACVHGIDVENVKILGRGILDNSHNHEVILYEENLTKNTMQSNNAKRQHTIQFEFSENIQVDGITIRDSLVYNFRMICCDGIHVSHAKVIGSWRYNTDSFNMHNSKNVLIEHCFFRSFDDAICVKGMDFYRKENVEQIVYDFTHHNGKVYDTCENVHARNCTIWSDYSQAFTIGAETQAEEICNVLFEDCDVIHFNCCILDCHNLHWADVHDITYQNIRVEYDDVILTPQGQTSDDHVYENANPNWTPYLIAMRSYAHPEYTYGSNRAGSNHDILMKDIYIYGKHRPKAKFLGRDEEHKTKDITIENLYWNGRPVTDWSEFELEWEEEFTENIQLIFTDK